jgi:hypothetical protein
VTEIGPEALISNPALRQLAFLLGTWRTTGTHPLVPGKTFHGRTSFGWHQGGAFLIMHSQIDEPEIPSGVAIIGSDDEAGTFFMSYFDERGISRRYEVEAGERTVTWRRDNAKFSQTMTIAADAGGDRLHANGRMARDGGDWEDDLALTYVRMRD